MRKRTHLEKQLGSEEEEGLLQTKPHRPVTCKETLCYPPVSAKEKRALCDMKSYIGPLPTYRNSLKIVDSLKRACTASIRNILQNRRN